MDLGGEDGYVTCTFSILLTKCLDPRLDVFLTVSDMLETVGPHMMRGESHWALQNSDGLNTKDQRLWFSGARRLTRSRCFYDRNSESPSAP